MENRSNTLLVFGVLSILLLALVAYVIWASPAGGHRKRLYDIFFDRSVAGLQEKSPVTLSGVTVGRVRQIRFDPRNPELIRVRVAIINPKAQILRGTTASLKHDLFGTATITLDGATTGAPPILPARYGEVAVIPAAKGSGLLGDPVSIVETLSATTDRLNQMLSPAGQRSITQRISELERRSGAVAARAPALADRLADADRQIRDGAVMAKQMDAKLDAMDQRVRAMRGAKAAQVREQLRSARASLARFDEGVNAARPKLETFTAPALTQQVQDLRSTAAGLGTAVQSIDRDGLGSASSPSKLPDFKAKK